MSYNHQKIEKKWRNMWAKNKKLYATQENSKRPHAYVLDMFPYPSAEGFHVGHPLGYTATDVYARFLRMSGYNVLHPMGWDAFGLPAENYAIKHKIHPTEVVKKNVENYKKQMDALGLSYDWSREVDTSDPKYYKWTQWIFLKLFEMGLAYEAELPINFCPSCKTGLANEEVVNGACERCGTEVVQKKLRQWVLRITTYAERLLADLNGLDWPEKIIAMQRNWIGKSEGALIKFTVESLQLKVGESLDVFTTRPDTLFGATYMVIAPEHSIVQRLESSIQNLKEVDEYVKKSGARTERERISEVKVKTGVEIKGIKAINPVNNQEIPIFISDYVLMGYGTGAIMAVPAHDQRDFEFAQKFDLPIKMVICPNYPAPICPILGKAYEGNGYLVSSGKFDGLEPEKAKKAIMEFVGGKIVVKYKLRDWIFSRQRYWGEPIPIIRCAQCGNVPVAEKDLPLRLPNVKNYEPTGTGESPLEAIEKWVKIKCPKCKGLARRETNTMPQWAGSCWYYLRYIDPKNKKTLVNPKKEQYWMGSVGHDKGIGGVDMYVGGAEHAVLHLLYARFWHKVLYDIGIVSTKEPFKKLINQGMMLGANGEKMSKSRGNVITVESVLQEHGADVLRMYEMFMGQFEDVKVWDTKSIVGIRRFMERVYRLITNCQTKGGVTAIDDKLGRLIHKTIKKVTEDIKDFHFNTAISALMILLNEMEKQSQLSIIHCQLLIKLLSPFAPHLSEELWQEMKGSSKTFKSVHQEKWPTFSQELLKEQIITLIIQINGKLRDTVEIDSSTLESEIDQIALSRPKIKVLLSGALPRKIFKVKNNLINLVL